jgi:hypothetical protein
MAIKEKKIFQDFFSKMNHSNFSADHSYDASFMQALVLDYERNQRKITPRETVLQILVLKQYYKYLFLFNILSFSLYWHFAFFGSKNG